MQVPAKGSPMFLVRRCKLAALIFLVAPLTAREGGLCQSPAGQPLGVYDGVGGNQAPFGVSYHTFDNDFRNDDLRLTWLASRPPFSQPGPVEEWAQDFSGDVRVDLPFLLLRVRRPVLDFTAGGPTASNDAGNLVLAFSSWRPNANRYFFEEGPNNLKLDTADKFYHRDVTGVAMDARGDFVVVWQSRGQEQPDRGTADTGVFARLVNGQGIPVGPEIHVNAVRQGKQRNPRVAMAAETGAFVVVWDTESDKGLQAAGQLFAPDGAKVGGEFRLGSVDPGVASPGQQVAMAPDGSFVVVWNETDHENGGFAISGQRFTAQGTPAGPVLRIAKGNLPRGQAVACDSRGNFVVIWLDGRDRTISRLYHSNGIPAGEPVALTRDSSVQYGMVAFGPYGTFAVAGTDSSSSGIDFAVVRRFSASPGEEICLFETSLPTARSEVELWCSTGRSGGVQVRHPLFGAQPGDVGLLGDIDGDGRADPCLFRNGVFLCDADHDYALDTAVAFGQAGDVPFLADIDGDGRADPCVYRVGRFLCDTAHDGGAPEVEIAFGSPGDVPLLGDIDGDGRADPCVFRSGTFLCDTNHDGVAEVEIHFGEAGDRVLLGDFDGDGRADPCVYRFGDLLCDTAHDGGEAEGRVELGLGDRSSIPVMGNLDGL